MDSLRLAGVGDSFHSAFRGISWSFARLHDAKIGNESALPAPWMVEGGDHCSNKHEAVSGFEFAGMGRANSTNSSHHIQ
jgi:hypothetical protein